MPLAEILSRAGVRPEARFVVFHCADTLDDGGEFGVDPESIRYCESIDFIDAAHPQTILAYEMNGKPLTVPPARYYEDHGSGSPVVLIHGWPNPRLQL